MSEPGPGRRISVGVIEDHPLYRYALTRVLTEAPDIELGAVADSVARFAVQEQPAGSVVVLAIKLRGVQDAAAVLEVGHMGHKVLVVSAHAEQPEVLGAMQAGAKGFQSKDVDGDELLRAIRTIADDNAYVSPTLAGMIIQDSEERHAGPKIVLSEREKQVLNHVEVTSAGPIEVATMRRLFERIIDETRRVEREASSH